MIKLIMIVLVIIHIILGIWALGGMLEWLNFQVPWNPFSNPEFPGWLLFFHWSSILFASAIFITGYLTRWNQTPFWMTIGYGLMALVCAVETFGYMTAKTKFLSMGLEYAAYILILFVLYNPSLKEQYFIKNNNSKL